MIRLAALFGNRINSDYWWPLPAKLPDLQPANMRLPPKADNVTPILLA
jgi:hypothetical protein